MHRPYHRRWLLTASFCAAAGCSLPEGPYFGHVPADPDARHLRYCNGSEPQYIDPALTVDTTARPITNALFDGLTRYNLEGLPIPSLAVSYLPSADLRRFTFRLRKDARWSNGRPLTSRDFAFHLARVLHPLTGAQYADVLWPIKNAELFTLGRVRMVVRQRGPFAPGDIVEVLPPATSERAGAAEREAAEAAFRVQLGRSNLRIARTALALRPVPSAAVADSEPYATVPAGEEVIIVELGGSENEWAYIFWPRDQGLYGWVLAARLQPAADAAAAHLLVRDVPASHLPTWARRRESGAVGRQASVNATDVLMVPDVLGIATPDDATLVLETHMPTPFLYDVTAQPVFRPTPREAVSRWPQRWTRPEHVVTSGPFHLREWRVRDYFHLVKSASFWDRNRVRLDEVTVYSIEDTAASANYYFHGGCDAVSPTSIPPAYLPILNGARRGGRRYADFAAGPMLGTYYYVVNTNRFPHRSFRRALALAIDRRPLPSILGGDQIPTSQFSPGVPIRSLRGDDLALCGVTGDTPGVALVVRAGELCYVPPLGLEHDLARAREELGRARREMGARFPSRITLRFNAGREGHKLVAEYVQEQWKKNLGLKVELEVQEWKTFLADTSSGNYDIARMGAVGHFPDPEAEFLPNLRCKAAANRARYCNPEFERLFREAESLFDRKARLAKIRTAERVMIEDAPVIPLFIYVQHVLKKPYVLDLAINAAMQTSFELTCLDPAWNTPRAKSSCSD